LPQRGAFGKGLKRYVRLKGNGGHGIFQFIEASKKFAVFRLLEIEGDKMVELPCKELHGSCLADLSRASQYKGFVLFPCRPLAKFCQYTSFKIHLLKQLQHKVRAKINNKTHKEKAFY
jgi:hypothetical protein